MTKLHQGADNETILPDNRGKVEKKKNRITQKVTAMLTGH